MAVRWACPDCDVLLNVPHRPVCEWCGKPMIPGHQYKNPCASTMANHLLDLLNQGDTI